MLALQYSHRLPSDYPMSTLRERARRRGPLWDDMPGLVFKAFVASERGVFQADANRYASVYLWQDAAAAGRFLTGDRFRSVIDSFGRPSVETWLPLAMQMGAARDAVSLEREEAALEDVPDGEALLDAEREHHRRLVAHGDVVAAWSVLDARTWRRIRFVLSGVRPPRRPGAQLLEVLYLAAPGLRQAAQ